MLVASEEGGEGDREMVERRGNVDLNGSLRFHDSVDVSLSRGQAHEENKSKIVKALSV